MTQIAQTSPSDTGASSAADYQPKTTNPQDVPAQVFPESASVQTPSSDSLLQNNVQQIIVPNNPAASQPAIAEAKSANWLLPLLIVVFMVIAWFVWMRKQRKQPKPVVQPLASTIPEPVSPSPKSSTPPAKKAAAKKSKSRRKKRARRS